MAKDFVSGLILLIERGVKVGDRIEVSNLLGDVKQIGARTTWVQTNGAGIWLRLQQAHDLWLAERSLGEELEKIPSHRAA